VNGSRSYDAAASARSLRRVVDLAAVERRSTEAAGREKDRAALPQMRQDFIDAGAL
jgi:hypothetical protein